ncbi:hypothetical protein CF319_g5683 [Tilletia indica]|uniref:Uncharacterized protein n=1 Tax=Tilletia indica TaxID=43049 RepID=A0A177T7H0_9BASI|nr:hypothetical protein CF319_g5683 [Tilletia indica]KAE8260523.1 hypothetical protein A4X13_0g253 [Tilletia indica]
MSISSRAPPEILIDVVDNLLGGSPPHSRQHHHHNTPTLQAAELVKADPSLKNVVQYHQDRNFITFTPNGPPRVVGSLGPWIPRESSHMTDHVKYFMHHLGEDWPLSIENESQIKQFDARKSSVTFQIRADARSPGFSRTHDCRLWVKKNMHLWLLVGSLLCRIAQPNPSLRILHLRLSAHAEFYPFVERILCSNKRLTDVIIEDDSHPDLDELLRPSIDLNSLSDGTDDDDFSQLDRFIIRAPAVRINAIESHRFFKRIKKATVICFAVHQFVTRPPTWEWIAHTLSHAPALQRCEFSASSSDESEYMFHHAQPPPVAKLPKLMHLTLDIPQVDIRLLDLLVAPVLKHTRIRCNNELNAHGDLAPGHFPALFCATVWCPGGARNRFRALGLKKLQYIHNIADADLYETDLFKEILVYVWPLTRVYSDQAIATMYRPNKRLRLSPA